MEGDRFVLRSITDEIMYELMTLSGQEYVDMYATKAKTEIAAGRRPATVVTLATPTSPSTPPDPPGLLVPAHVLERWA